MAETPTELLKHDFTCTDQSEMILFTPAFGPSTEPGEGAEVVLDPSGMVVELRNAREGSIPDDSSVLSGTGEGADWLRDHAQPGLKVRVQVRLQSGGASLGGKTGVVQRWSASPSRWRT